MFCICGPQIFLVLNAGRRTPFRHFSRTYIAGHTCLTENKIWVFHHRGGICPILRHPNTRDVPLLLFYTTVSLNFGRRHISEHTTHSSRMVKNQYHAPTPDSTRCQWAYEMHDVNTFYFMAHVYMSAKWNINTSLIIIIFTYNLNPLAINVNILTNIY